MKFLTITISLLFSLSLHAESTSNKEDKGKIQAAAENVSSKTKMLLRKVGRKSMDETCELTESKAECEKQKAQHKALTEKEAIEGVPAN